MLQIIIAVLGFIFAMCGIATCIPILWKDSKKGFLGRKISVSAIIIGILLGVFSCSFVIIPTGYTGVRKIFDQVSYNTTHNGFNFRIPFVESVVLVDNRQRDVTITSKIWGESKEKTVVFAESVVVTYKINPNSSAWICANVSDYKNLLSGGIVSSGVKSAMSELNSDEVTQRTYIEPLSKNKIQLALDEKYGNDVIEVVKVTIYNIDFEDSYNQVIADKQIAKQNREKAEIENETKIKNAEAEAETKRIIAQGEADAKLIEARAEADANKIKEQSVTEKIIQDKIIEKWSGELPKVMGEFPIILDGIV